MLKPGGVLIFDAAGPSRGLTNGIRCSEGRDWAVISRTTLQGRGLLRRRITAFRKIGKGYRRSEEVHDVRLYASEDLQKDLIACGFRVRILRGYGQFLTPPGITVFVATKP